MTNYRRNQNFSTYVFALTLAVMLGDCSRIEAMREATAHNEWANKVLPQNYKVEILALMRNYLNDPTQVRDAQISDPVIKPIAGADRYIVCFRYNAKKSDGQYAGSKTNIVTFREGRLDRIIDSVRPSRAGRSGFSARDSGDSEESGEVRETREQCKDVPLKPFPELEHLTR
ncbi:MAG TPA: hypothetical protein VET48_02310 [Steroidobacteraceae bacterium]|nr:hypothetical protein [Steroidobacteraceae bacterium]